MDEDIPKVGQKDLVMLEKVLMKKSTEIESCSYYLETVEEDNV